MTHLFTFVGQTDLAAAGLGRSPGVEDGPGPVAGAVDSGVAEWSGVTLRDDRGDSAIAPRYADWLRARGTAVVVDVVRAPLFNPAAFGPVLAAARAAVQARAPESDAERTYLTTPGTAAMAMAWLYLALQPDTRARLLTAHRGASCQWLPVAPVTPAGLAVVLRGIPGAGKTTLAHELARAHGLDPAHCVFSTDDRFDEFNGGVLDAPLLPRMH